MTRLGLPKDAYRRRIWDTWEVKRWIDRRTAVVHADSVRTVVVEKEGKEEIQDLSVDFLLTIRFAENGRWKVIESHEMTTEEVAEQNKAPEPDE